MIHCIASLLSVFIPCVLPADDAPDPTLVAHYCFSEGQGETLIDHSGHEHHGRIVGAQWERVGQRWALRFDGSGDFVDFGDDRALKPTGDFTMLAWVTLDAPAYPDGTTNWTIFDCEAYPTEGTILRVDGAAATVLFRSSRAGAHDDRFGKVHIANRGCYLIGVVRQGDRVRIIVDGVTDVGFDLGGNPIYGATPWKISSPGQSFAGLMHAARIYSRALDVAEIAAEYWRGAQDAGKDVSRHGQLLLRGSVYAADPQVLADVEFLGVLPLAEGEQAVVALVRADGAALQEQVVDRVPDTCRGEYTFELADQPAGQYALEALVRDRAGQTRALARHAFGYPVTCAAVVPSPRTYAAPALAGPRPRLQPAVEVQPGGGFIVRASSGEADVSFPVESSYSVPSGADLALVAGPAAAERVSVEGPHVTVTNRHYRLDRDIRVQAELGRVLVRDTFTNLTDEPVGVIFENRVAIAAPRLKDVYLAGRTVMKPTTRSLKTSPTVFAHVDGFGIGLVALDDVLIVQLQGSRTDEGLSVGSSEFALDARDHYTVEWAMYVNASGDYYDFINAVRADEGRNNTTVAGTWVSPGQLMYKRVLEHVPPPSYFAVRRPAYFCIPCLSWATDDPTVSLEGIEFLAYPQERAAVRRVIDAVLTSQPRLQTMFHIAPNLYATNEPDTLWPDSRLIGPDGRQTVYAYNYESCSYFTKERVAENWRWWSYYPAVDNSYGQALLDSVDVMMDQMGASGVFVDGALWDYGGAYSYDRFDGHTADIDPQTKTITRLKTAVPLLQQHAIAAWGRTIMDRGGVVVINNAIPTRTFAGQPFIFDREVTEGPEMHLFSTPCTLGNAYAIQSETDVYADVLAKLAWGNLYFYYGEPVGMRHELPPARMYPITVTDVRRNCVTGRERVVTALDGVYGWPADRGLHLVYRYDRRGRRIGHNFVTTIDSAGARTGVDLLEGEMAIVARLPVTLESATPINVLVTHCDEQSIGMSLHGHGAAVVTGPDGQTQAVDLDGACELTIRPGAAG